VGTLHPLRPVLQLEDLAVKSVTSSFLRAGLTLLALIAVHGAQAQTKAGPLPTGWLHSSTTETRELHDMPEALEAAGQTPPVVRELSQMEAAAATASLNCSVYCGVPVSYTSWKSNAYTLQQYTGRNVRVLVPQHWYDDATFTEDARRQFIDTFDVIFDYLTDLVGGVPPGSQPITVAFVNPPGCGWGCGVTGGRGVEITDAPDNKDNEVFWTTSAAGFHTYGIVHEMTHNFDIYGKEFEFSALPDNSHYWTYIMRSIYAFTRTRTSDTPPEEYDVGYEQSLFKYVQTAGASWQTCVINQQCDSAINGYFAPIGVFYRLVHLYGRSVETRYTAFQKARKAAIPNPTDQDKLDGFFEGYSAAANRNMNCLWDMLNWPVSAAARSWADTNFPNANPDCTNVGPGGNKVIVDIQPDFLSPVDGSYTKLQDSGSGFSQNIWSPTKAAVPAYILVQAISGKSQYFQLTGSGGNQRVRVTTCSPNGGFSGGTTLWVPNSGGGLTGWGGPQFTPGVCNTTQWKNASDVEVQQGSGATGAYSIQAEVNPYGQWPLSRLWANLSVTRNADGSFSLSLAQIDATQVLPTATQVRFWVQNYGWVASVPWPGAPVPATLTATWTPPSGETGDGLVFRAQVLGAAGEGYASDQANPVIYYVTPRKPLYAALTPARLLDTRVGASFTTIDGTAQGTGPIASLGTYRLPVAGRAGIPSGVVAVALNVTPVTPAARGYFTIWSGTGAAPNASNLNLNPGYTIPNFVVSPVDAGGNIAIFNGSGAAQDAVVDVQGYFPSGSAYVPMTPQRYLDTRSGGTTVDGQNQGAGALSRVGRLDLGIAGRSSIPASGVDAVIFNLTAVQPTSAGYITAWPSNVARPNASNLNLNVGLTIPNVVISGLGSSGNVSLFNGAANATDLIADVQGWFPSNSGYAALPPARLLDTRSGQSTIDGQYAGSGALAHAGTLDLQVTGRGGVPTDSGVGAVILNVTAVQPASGGYVTVWPTGATQPLASNLNLNPGTTIPNLVIAKVGANGKVSIFNGSQTATDILVDVQGWLPVMP
jgi:hypothetical protein